MMATCPNCGRTSNLSFARGEETDDLICISCREEEASSSVPSPSRLDLPVATS